MRKLIIPTYGGVYKIVNLKNGKVYVGSAKNFKKRWHEHLSALCRGKHTKHIQNAFIKYGQKFFIFLIQEQVEDKNQRVHREQYWIDFYKSYLPENGYNSRPKAESNLGMKHSKETKQKISQANKGRKVSEETRRKIGDAGKGRKVSKETKQKMSLVKIGKRHSLQSRNQMSNSHKGKILSEEHKIRIGNSQRGKIVGIETRKNLSIAITGSKRTLEQKQRASEESRRIWQRPGYRNRMSEIHKDHKVSPETKIKIAEAVKKRWADPELRKNFKKKESI